MTWTTYSANKINDHVLGVASYTAPATLYLALYIGDPLGAGTEVSDPAYARKVVAFSAAAAGTSTNSGEVIFNQATEGWGTLSHFAVFDAVTGGNMLRAGSLAQAEGVNPGNVIRFDPSTLSLTTV